MPAGGRWTLAVAGGLLLNLSGCWMADSRTANQGGGSIISAGSKLAAGDIGGLTPDEWQILCDNAPTLLPAFAAQYGIDVSSFEWPVLDDQQAQAIVDYLAINNIRSVADLQNAISAGALTQPPQELLDLLAPYMDDLPWGA